MRLAPEHVAVRVHRTAAAGRVECGHCRGLLRAGLAGRPHVADRQRAPVCHPRHRTGSDPGPGRGWRHPHGLPRADFPGGEVDDADDGAAFGLPARADFPGSDKARVGGVKRDPGTVWRGGDRADSPRDRQAGHGQASGPALTVDGEPEESCLMRGGGDGAGSRLDRTAPGGERGREEGPAVGGRGDPSGQQPACGQRHHRGDRAVAGAAYLQLNLAGPDVSGHVEPWQGRSRSAAESARRSRTPGTPAGWRTRTCGRGSWQAMPRRR